MNENLNNQKNNCLSILLPCINKTEESIDLAMSLIGKENIIQYLCDIKSDIEKFVSIIDEIDQVLKNLGCN